MRSKWEILEERRDQAMNLMLALNEELEALERTVAGSQLVGQCSKCATLLPTEADFAKHFLIPDERYLNLGVCPYTSEV